MSKSAPDPTSTIDLLVQDLGLCGRFQCLFYVLVYGSMTTAAFSVLMMAFGGVEPEWACQWRTRDGVLLNTSLPNQCSISNETDVVCETKTFGSEISTVVNEWDLTCEKGWVISTITTIQLGGLLFGAFISGQCSDIFGRKPTFFLSFVFLFVSNLVAIFSINWEMFAVVRFFIGVASGWYLTIYIIVLAEFTATKYRSLAVAFPGWPIGTMLFGFCCWVFKDWRQIQIMTSVICIPWLFGLLFLPESFRWLISKGKVQAATEAVGNMYSLNKRVIPNKDVLLDVIEHASSDTSSKHRQYTVLDIFRRKLLIKNTLLLFVCWYSCGYGYYAISFGVDQLSGDLYLNMVLLGLVDCVQIVVSWISNRIGRKRTTLAFFIIASITGIGVGIIQCLELSNKGEIINGLAFTSKLCVNSGWIALIILTSESYPTVVRNVGFGLNNAIARVGAMTAPQLVYASKHIPGVSYLLLGAMFLLSCLCIAVIPETNNKALKDNIEDC